MTPAAGTALAGHLPPRLLTPEAAVRKVTNAASRASLAARALLREEPKALSSASPATASMRIGDPATKLVAAPAIRPSTI